MIEELGMPLPIPTDFMSVFAGAAIGPSLVPLLGLGLALTLASAVGASGLYAVCRRGGRPLVERFGRYVHLGPERLTRAERLLWRAGWPGIAAGRAVPGLRYATVVACGLLKVPYPRFVTAHIAGSSVYVAVYLTLGASLGPGFLAALHLPAIALRLLWLLPLAAGLPLLSVWLAGGVRRRGRPAPPLAGSTRPGAVALGSLAGATALCATLATVATAEELLGAPRRVDPAYALVGWISGPSLDVDAAVLSLYATLLALLVALGVAYYGAILPRLRPNGASGALQVAGLFGAVALLLSALALAPVMLFRDETSYLAASGGWSLMLVSVAAGATVYAVTVVNSRALAFSKSSKMRVGE
jgi:membrane protein DedA with SNARE-associated domain